MKLALNVVLHSNSNTTSEHAPSKQIGNIFIDIVCKTTNGKSVDELLMQIPLNQRTCLLIVYT